jgi:diguanylate cyclase (GGDEF)-like protein/PAS domain S-box-containing protein
MDNDLPEEHEALLQFLYLAPIGLMQTQVDGEILMVNPVCAQLLMPLSPDGCLTNAFDALAPVAPDLRHRVQAHEASHGLVCEGLPLRLTLNPADRRAVRHLSLTVMKLDATRLMLVLGDVTQQVLRERALRHSQAWVQSLVSGLTDYALASLDDRGELTAWNASIERLTGHTREGCEGRSVGMLFPPDAMTPQLVADRLHEADREGWSLDEGWLLRADGSRFWGSCLIAPLHPPGEVQPEERAYSLVVRDVSDRREASEALRRAFSCDHLTGLANRRALYEAAELELQRWRRAPRPLSVLMVDADHFKAINDRHGHAAGDAVLRQLAAALSACFRAVDVVARLGGEEFVVLLPGTSPEGAQTVAARLCDHVASQVVQVGEQAVRCTVSVGVAVMDETLDGVDALLARADQALYAAKAQGRNRVVPWQPAMAQTRRCAALP